VSAPEPGCTCTRTFGGDGIAVRHHDCPVHGDHPVLAPEPMVRCERCGGLDEANACRCPLRDPEPTPYTPTQGGGNA
jgi:hypothetical protein